MSAPIAVQYAPLSATCVLNKKLQRPVGFSHNYAVFVVGVPHYRLNLLATDGQRLYFGHCATNIAVYNIVRSGGVSLSPLASPSISPPTTINNVRLASLPNGKRVLLLTGGDERGGEPGSLTLLRLPHSDHPPGKAYEFATARTLTFPWASAWGLAVHEATDRIAFGSNSHCIVRLPIENFLAGNLEADEVQVLRNRHFHNIPCVAFSPDGKWIASASIDSTFGVHRISDEPVREGQEPLERWKTFSKMTGSEQLCWCVHWIDDVRLGAVESTDPVWSILSKQRNAILSNTEDWCETLHNAYSFQRDAEEISFWKHTQSSDIWPDPGTLHLYDDCAHLDENKTSQPCFEHPDELDMHRIHGEEDIARAVKPVNGGRARDTIDIEALLLPSVPDKSPSPESSEAEASPGRPRLFLVCRETKVVLYLVREKKARSTDPEDTELEFKELDCLELVASGSREFCFLDAKEISGLDAIVLSVRGLGVILLRIICPEGGVRLASASTRWLFVERVIARMITPFNSPAFLGDFGKANVIGTAIVYRGQPDAPDYYAELWIAWQDCVIQCWELSRAPSLFDARLAII